MTKKESWGKAKMLLKKDTAQRFIDFTLKSGPFMKDCSVSETALNDLPFVSIDISDFIHSVIKEAVEERENEIIEKIKEVRIANRPELLPPNQYYIRTPDGKEAWDLALDFVEQILSE